MISGYQGYQDQISKEDRIQGKRLDRERKGSREKEGNKKGREKLREKEIGGRRRLVQSSINNNMEKDHYFSSFLSISSFSLLSFISLFLSLSLFSSLSFSVKSIKLHAQFFLGKMMERERKRKE